VCCVLCIVCCGLCVVRCELCVREEAKLGCQRTTAIITGYECAKKGN